MVDLPSAPPLRDGECRPRADDVVREPHQRSVGLEASTSELEQRSGFLGLGDLLQPKSAILLGGLFSAVGYDTSKPSSVLAAIGVLAVIVAVHEAGHFAAARLQGIRVTRFAVGFGPTLVKYQDGEVEYCLNAIPLGGYVAFPEDDPAASNPSKAATDAPAADGAASASSPSTSGAEGAAAASSPAATTTATAATSTSATAAAPATPSYSPDDPDLLKNRPIAQRALVISAGVIANIVFAYLILLLQISTVGKAETAFLPGVRVALPEAPAAVAASAGARGGLVSGDVLLRIGDVTVPAAPSQVGESVAAIRAAAGKPLELTVRRAGTEAAADGAASGSGQVLKLRVTPEAGADGQGRLGVQLSSNTYIKHTYAANAGEVLAMTQSEFNRLAGTVFGGLQQIITNFGAMSGQLSGPVAIVAAGSEVVRTDAAGLFQFAAIVNINLAAVNILPLPALDGGYLALLALEALRGGRKLPAGLEGGIMASGFLVLTALGMGLVIRDTLNLL
ncbi:hypothetical protein GPECTOR_63g44 [Gonium pectorale]|uniref:Peptidase M50 domain-containing protein n=1 Tax=Gonium pectorale TaxID=33097 RepID=A0A150G4H1_GONPE|nr:hypothetical protein GPECTOR_63g44 [Gonium pectorale]|eukprot:KXZ44718.1 hypothetical protein GPECTOR_63g44 [Gonium pectorale]